MGMAEEQEQQGLPAEVMVGLYRDEIGRLAGENTDLRLENRWLQQVAEALQQQLQAMADHTHEGDDDGPPQEE